VRFVFISTMSGYRGSGTRQLRGQASFDAERLIRVYKQARQAFFVSQRNRSLLETQLGVVLNNAVLVKKSIRRVMGCLGVLAR